MSCRGPVSVTSACCDAAKRACVIDLCCGVRCGEKQFCEPTTGACTDTCIDKVCPTGQVCLDGQCGAPRCAGVMCREIEVCDPRSGQCVPNLCGAASCVPGFTCCAGMCNQDLCKNLRCPQNYRCITDPISCSHNCDTLIVPDQDQDKLVGAGGGGLACNLRDSRPSGDVILLLAALALVRSPRRKRK